MPRGNWADTKHYEAERIALGELRLRGWKMIQWTSMEQDNAPYDAVFREGNDVRFVLVRTSLDKTKPQRLDGKQVRALLNLDPKLVRIVVVESWKVYPSVRIYTLEDCLQRNRVRLVMGAKRLLQGVFGRPEPESLSSVPP